LCDIIKEFKIIFNIFMEQYPVPQFIEQEGRIAFFLSFRQFFYLIGAGAICFILYYILPRLLFYIAAIVISLASVALAFVQINGAPLVNILLASIGFSMGGKNYTWKKKESLYPFKTVKRTVIKKIDQGPVLKAQESQLRKTKTNVELKTK
jgi:hypothetical protein